MVLDKMPAQDRRLGREVWVSLDAAESGLWCSQCRIGESDPIELSDRFGGQAQNPLGNQKVID
jgi:hypothetical protein